ncbi:hypothetical protein KRR55_19940 [Paeniglutamicibacter sp. ABSL32-1]|uniref:hypothetical protein n=1 Tax=Paeniglutamicibacter quisquiliarum TaxID=2849498 RepID=UPI001C2D9ED5|nr:hypothetical protein [Paeniglutamicibacter quisquiliarum]MBV1781377.1 hypothetical protein [Paeniglutamicibacter quisquiliarum]
MSTGIETDTRTRWGRIRFAGRRLPAMAFAIPTGLLLASGVGALTLWTGVAEGEQAIYMAGVFALVMSWGFVGLVWAVVVDRKSLRGAIDKPDDSIESTWMDTATAGAFRDTIMLTGLGLGILSITGYELDAVWALTGVIVLGFFSTWVRYLMAKKRG